MVETEILAVLQRIEKLLEGILEELVVGHEYGAPVERLVARA